MSLEISLLPSFEGSFCLAFFSFCFSLQYIGSCRCLTSKKQESSSNCPKEGRFQGSRTSTRLRNSAYSRLSLLLDKVLLSWGSFWLAFLATCEWIKGSIFMLMSLQKLIHLSIPNSLVRLSTSRCPPTWIKDQCVMASYIDTPKLHTSTAGVQYSAQRHSYGALYPCVPTSFRDLFPEQYNSAEFQPMILTLPVEVMCFLPSILVCTKMFDGLTSV